ncbi:MAG: hypothetical protein LDL31_01195 [Prosthecobacter sp.]|jgi:hypothetical protein|nr:hypothetical protein [Prosthecobacter sp.]
MNVHLDWFGCEPHPAREHKIHQMLENLRHYKHLTRASLRIEETKNSGTPFHLTLMLSMAGPDILVHGRGQTFDEALMKTANAATKVFETRAQKQKQVNGAATGVKAIHRG